MNHLHIRGLSEAEIAAAVAVKVPVKIFKKIRFAGY